MAMLSVPTMSQNYGLAGNGGVDVLGTGIFETDGAAFRFPSMQDTNIDSLDVGNDKALAFGNIWQKTRIATATNNLEIKKNQDSGNCSPCVTETIVDEDYYLDCSDPCTKVNIEQINVGNREAMAFGPASAANYIKIVTNQQ
jgi:hypothetical protein